MDEIDYRDGRMGTDGDGRGDGGLGRGGRSVGRTVSQSFVRSVGQLVQLDGFRAGVLEG